MIRCVREGRTCQHAHSARVCSPALLASAFAPRCEEEIEKSRSAGGSSERRRGAALYPFRRSTSRGAPFSVWELPASGSICSPDGHGIRHSFGTAAACSPRLVCLTTAWSGGAGVGAARLSAWRPTPESTRPSPCSAAGPRGLLCLLG